MAKEGFIEKDPFEYRPEETKELILGIFGRRMLQNKGPETVAFPECLRLSKGDSTVAGLKCKN
jgi:hypothetical protein